MSRDADLADLVAYDTDYRAWMLQQVELLRAGRLSRLDIDHLVEELSDLANSPKREIENRLCILLMHLLKWEFQPSHRSNSWRATITEQRLRIAREIKRNPSLRRHPAAALPDEYEAARIRAWGETDLPLDTFPEACPYTAAQALDDAFWPGALT